MQKIILMAVFEPENHYYSDFWARHFGIAVGIP
jgi:hypothetical protein